MEEVQDKGVIDFELKHDAVLGTVVHVKIRSIHREVTVSVVAGADGMRDFARRLLDRLDSEG